MSVPLTGLAGIFTRWDAIASILNNLNNWRGTGWQIVSSLIGNGTTTTVTTPRAHGYTTGDTVLVSGASPTTPNGSFTITVTTTTAFTYLSSYNGTATGLIECAKTAGVGNGFVSVSPLVNSLYAQFPATDQAQTTALYSTLSSYQGIHSTLTQYLQSLAQSLLMSMVQDDSPQPVQSVSNAMSYLISQISGAAQSVQKPLITTSITVGGSNIGNGTLAVSVLGPNGLQLDYLFPENISLLCTADGQSGGVAAQEQFAVLGPAAETDPLNWDWPLGSGVNTALNAIDFLQNNAGGNVLTNSGFQTQTVANTPDNWPIQTGTPGTTITAATGANVYRGTQALGFIGNSAELTSIYQPFGASPGTSAVLQPLTQYGLEVVDKVSSVPAAGALEIALTDGNGNIVNDAQGNPNVLTLGLSTATTSFVPHTFFIRTPAVTPATGYRVRVRLSTALSTGSTVYFQLGANQPSPLYTGGPLACLWAGSTNFIQQDKFTLGVTNALSSRWQLFLERVFQMRSLGLQMPSSNSPTIS